MAQDYRPGGPFPAGKTIAICSEAMLSASEQLYIRWVGRSIATTSPRAPSGAWVGQFAGSLERLWANCQGNPMSR